MEWRFIMIGLACLMGIYLVGTVLFRPFKFLIRLAAWMLLGGVLLMAINTVFGNFGLHIAINPVTILTAGVLQLPGLVLLVLVNYLIM
ncbi:MAG: SigmaK-factor processing regulatory protein BofA [Pelotomaculum sp. PtaU1.Bin035]|nr:MAG: SigmaK-factor processing regulatory protein BofA [Pelotomaculum sp. PtaU1.Bin035]